MFILLCAGDIERSGYFVYDTRDKATECVGYAEIHRAFVGEIPIYGVSYDSNADKIVCHSEIMNGVFDSKCIATCCTINFAIASFRVINEDDEYDNTVITNIYSVKTRACIASYATTRIGTPCKIRLSFDDQFNRLQINIDNLRYMGEDGRLRKVRTFNEIAFANDGKTSKLVQSMVYVMD